MSSRRQVLRSLLLETGLYVPLVAAYFFLVLRLLGDFLHDCAVGDLRLYAWLSLIVLLGQAILLDALAGMIMRFLKVRR
ncbi:hypothetical protein DYH09_31840 [bacterium CPR1]|nr:hypothetical protein [bacterium CPR1]